jgi:GNAT superfamily N-acetyltransferase
VFREARSGDLGGILRLYRQLHPEDPDLSDDAAAATFARILESPGLRVFVVESDGQVVATAYLNVTPNLTRSGAPYGVIENVVVDESRRRTGLGTRVIEGALGAAWDAGCYKVMLMTGSQRPSVHAFYRSCGFSSDPKTAFIARP